MPGGLMSLFLRLLRDDGHRRRFVPRHRRHGVGGLRRRCFGVRCMAGLVVDEAAPLQPLTRAVVEAEADEPLLRSSTAVRVPGGPLVQVRDGDALAFVSTPTGASVFALGSGVSGSSNHAVVDIDALVPRLPSPTPATPPTSPRVGVRRRLLALGIPLASSPSSGRPGTRSPAALGLTNGASCGVASGTHLPGGSSDEEGRGGNSSRRL